MDRQQELIQGALCRDLFALGRMGLGVVAEEMSGVGGEGSGPVQRREQVEAYLERRTGAAQVSVYTGTSISYALAKIPGAMVIVYEELPSQVVEYVTYGAQGDPDRPRFHCAGCGGELDPRTGSDRDVQFEARRGRRVYVMNGRAHDDAGCRERARIYYRSADTAWIGNPSYRVD